MRAGNSLKQGQGLICVFMCFSEHYAVDTTGKGVLCWWFNVGIRLTLSSKFCLVALDKSNTIWEMGLF